MAQNNSQQDFNDVDDLNQHIMQPTTTSNFLLSQLTTNPTTNPTNSNIVRLNINSDRSQNNNERTDSSPVRPLGNATVMEPSEPEDSDNCLS